jgi:serine/threonine-protein kinase
VDRQGHETPIPAPPGAYSSPRLSPDGTRVALESLDDQGDEIWVWDLARHTLARLTFDPAADVSPVWTPDGRRIVFASTRSGVFNLYARAADGAGTDVRLTVGTTPLVPTSVTPDGAFVVGYEIRPQTGRDLVRVAMDREAGGSSAGTTEVESLVETQFAEFNGEVSPDGRYLTYQSNESGRAEVYVRPYPLVRNGRWQVSTGGGTRPAWTRRGRELVYLDIAARITAVPVETSGSTFRAGTPATLFPHVYAVPNVTRSFDVSADGQRFLMIKESAGGTEVATPPGLVVVQNWTEELKRLMPMK